MAGPPASSTSWPRTASSAPTTAATPAKFCTRPSSGSSCGRGEYGRCLRTSLLPEGGLSPSVGHGNEHDTLVFNSVDNPVRIALQDEVPVFVIAHGIPFRCLRDFIRRLLHRGLKGGRRTFTS